MTLNAARDTPDTALEKVAITVTLGKLVVSPPAMPSLNDSDTVGRYWIQNRPLAALGGEILPELLGIVTVMYCAPPVVSWIVYLAQARVSPSRHTLGQSPAGCRRTLRWTLA